MGFNFINIVMTVFLLNLAISLANGIMALAGIEHPKAVSILVNDTLFYYNVSTMENQTYELLQNPTLEQTGTLLWNLKQYAFGIVTLVERFEQHIPDDHTGQVIKNFIILPIKGFLTVITLVGWGLFILAIIGRVPLFSYK